MKKHSRPDDAVEEHDVKRARRYPRDRLSCVSDELLLRILSHLPVPTLVLCQRLSNRFRIVAGDSQLWKAAYYERFVRPRALRIPGIREESGPSNSLLYSSKISKWLDDESLVKRGTETNWKRQYKLRHNWSRGSCDVREIQVANRPPIPPLLVRLHEGIAVTVDSLAGLRAWNIKQEQKLVAETRLETHSLPTSLTINTQPCEDAETIEVAIGFEDGKFAIYVLDARNARFNHRYTHARSTTGMITAIATSSRYLLTLAEAQILSLYTFDPDPSCRRSNTSLDPPRLLASLKSHTVWPPLSLSLRPSQQNIVASIAYALPTYISGWSVGLQELRLSPEGTIMESHLASAVTQGFTSLSPSASCPGTPTRSTSTTSPGKSVGHPAGQQTSKPTSLSYTHPYLLASHPDNTLTLYLVSSTAAGLSISGGSRLWGHTSSVSGAHVGGRGKAVSVSSRGDEIRVWELEGGIGSTAARRRLAAGQMSVQIQPEKRLDEDGSGAALEPVDDIDAGLASALDAGFDDLAITRGWVAFDEEKVVVLREKPRGSQSLFVYDFT